MKGYSLDPHPKANVADKHFAVIYAPRKKRDRFPETTVTLFKHKEDALVNESSERKMYAAEVIGPARSSEGTNIYYLVSWLTEEK